MQCYVSNTLSTVLLSRLFQHSQTLSSCESRQDRSRPWSVVRIQQEPKIRLTAGAVINLSEWTSVQFISVWTAMLWKAFLLVKKKKPPAFYSLIRFKSERSVMAINNSAAGERVLAQRQDCVFSLSLSVWCKKLEMFSRVLSGWGNCVKRVRNVWETESRLGFWSIADPWAMVWSSFPRLRLEPLVKFHLRAEEIIPWAESCLRVSSQAAADEGALGNTSTLLSPFSGETLRDFIIFFSDLPF